jgi:glutaminyl-peptide cyclotransferase
VKITFIIMYILTFLIAGCGSGNPPHFDGVTAYTFLVEQCEIGPRNPGSPGHREVQRYIVERLKVFGANVSLQQFDATLTTGDTLHLINIIGNYNLGAKERLLFGTHYDTRPRADRDGNPENRSQPIPGANDGASGVAVLLEIARNLGDVTPPVGVDLVFFDGEDYGEEDVPQDYILGSTYFAGNLKGYRPYAVIIVDMIGERDAEIKLEGFSQEMSSALLQEVFQIAEDLGIASFKRERGSHIIDDHLPFLRGGIPAIVLIDFDYPFWHTLEDTPDKCSPESLAAVGEVLLAYLWRQR